MRSAQQRVGGVLSRCHHRCPSPTARTQITHRADDGADLHANDDPTTVLSFTPDEWTAFLAGIRNREYERQAA